MKFGKYLKEKERKEWTGQYVDYKRLKDLIKDAYKEYEESGATSYSPRTTSLTVPKARSGQDTSEELFFRLLEAELAKIGTFTEETMSSLRSRLYKLQMQLKEPEVHDKKDLLKEAQSIGDEFLQLEKYVNLNYMGFHKILKKHDKQLPHYPCRQFYVSHLHSQPWIQGSFSDLLVTLGKVYAELRGDPVVTAEEEEKFHGYSSNKYWIHMADISKVKHMILPHLPVYQFDENDYTGDSQLVNSVYLDNASLEVYHGRLGEQAGASAIRLRWYGSREPSEVYIQRKMPKVSKTDEETLQHEFVLPARLILPFIEGALDADEAELYWKLKNYTEEEISEKRHLFESITTMVDSKQLKPTVRTQFMRTLFQVPFDSTVRIKLDTNICMMKENVEDGPGYLKSGRWFRDPSLPLQRTEITRFPLAALELKLALVDGQETPLWVQELVESGLLEEANAFSKHLHGISTLFSDIVQSVPYWIDRESIRASILVSAPEKKADIAPTARDQMANKVKPRKGNADNELLEPLLPTAENEDASYRKKLYKTPEFIEWWFSKPQRKAIPRAPGVVGKTMDPKTYFANERTFLSWLHMALTMGSIATGMIGISAGTKGDLSTLIAAILLPISLFMCGYALIIYYWRAIAIKQSSDLYYDDRRGPLALAVVVTSALSAIMVLSIWDMVSVIHSQGYF